MRRRAALAMLLCLTAAAGCDADAGDAGDGEGAACAERPSGEVTLGTGEDAFEPADGGVRMTAGPQGGYHIWISLRCRHLGPEVTVFYGVRKSGTDERLSPFGLKRSVVLSTLGEATGLYAYLNSGLDTEALVGEEVTLWAEVTDDCGDAPVSAEAESVIVGYD